ncbi:MAG: hypothetical protein CVU63_17110, partial [Deltaproteobacteria bacterium HGW-Deltaproteobacteria-20]
MALRSSHGEREHNHRTRQGASNHGGRAMAEKKNAPKRMTKAQVVAELAETAQIDKKAVNAVLSGLADIVNRELG